MPSPPHSPRAAPAALPGTPLQAQVRALLAQDRPLDAVTLALQQGSGEFAAATLAQASLEIVPARHRVRGRHHALRHRIQFKDEYFAPADLERRSRR